MNFSTLRLVLRVSATLAASASMVLTFVMPAHADVVDFHTLGTFNTNGPYMVGGLTITGSGPLSFYSNDTFGGLGILGRTNFGSIEFITGSEFATFFFNAGSATAVSLEPQAVIKTGGNQTLNMSIQGYGVGGGSLGVQSFTVGTGQVNVSSLFNNAALTAFTLNGGLPDDGINVRTITFTPTAANTTVPEPGSLALLMPILGTLLTGEIVLRKRRRK